MFSSKFSTGILKHPGYNVGGGIGEAALIGAAFGGAKSLATGEDPLEGALLGGLSGGAMNAATGAILGQGASNLPGITEAAAPAYEVLPPNTITDVIAPQMQVAAQNAENLGIAGANIAPNMGQVIPVGGYVPGQAIAGEAGTTLGRTAPQWIGEAAAQQGNAVAPIVNQGIAGTGNAMRDTLGITPDSSLGKGLDWWDKQSMLAKTGYAGMAGYGLGALDQKPFEAPVPQKYKSKLAGMSEDYQALANPTPVYPRFAEGGIAAMADGGINTPTPANVDFMGGDMYPQSQQQRSFYATPTQMPTSAQQAMASYEPNTNPLTGQPVAHMADGGTTTSNATPNFSLGDSFSLLAATNPGVASSYLYGAGQGVGGGVPAMVSQGFNRITGEQMPVTAPINVPSLPQTMAYKPTTSSFPGTTSNTVGYPATPAPVAKAPISTPQQPAQATQGTPNYNGTYNEYLVSVGQQPVSTGNIPLGQWMYKYASAKGGIVDSRKMAEGGIAGYNLGGYASGGNPRLLKGPGDGMSDNIPATIGDRQPARLADGEFVVPADVVSHLGNGSTDAGAKHLYAMMDNVRKARTGSKKQGKQIKPEKYLPTKG